MAEPFHEFRRSISTGWLVEKKHKFRHVEYEMVETIKGTKGEVQYMFDPH